MVRWQCEAYEVFKSRLIISLMINKLSILIPARAFAAYENGMCYSAEQEDVVFCARIEMVISSIPLLRLKLVLRFVKDSELCT